MENRHLQKADLSFIDEVESRFEDDLLKGSAITAYKIPIVTQIEETTVESTQSEPMKRDMSQSRKLDYEVKLMKALTMEEETKECMSP